MKCSIKKFSEMYETVYRDLYRYALCLMKNPQEAEDAVSEAVIIAYENIHKLKKEEAFKSWIFTILTNKCKKRLKKALKETPGREEETTIEFEEESEYEYREDFSEELLAKIAAGLGAKKNIGDIDCCVTRLRCGLKDISLVDDAMIRETGSRGILKRGNSIQIIYGPHVTVLKSEFEDYLRTRRAKKEIKQVIEGVNCAKAAMALANKNHVTMPIVEQINAILFSDKTAEQAVADLLMRDKASEYKSLTW